MTSVILSIIVVATDNRDVVAVLILLSKIPVHKPNQINPVNLRSIYGLGKIGTWAGSGKFCSIRILPTLRTIFLRQEQQNQEMIRIISNHLCTF